MSPLQIPTVLQCGWPPERAWTFVCDPEHWSTFVGYGPVPGIVRARLIEGGAIERPGSRIRVDNTDGTTHHEVVVASDVGRHFALRMELGGIAAWLFASFEEDLRFEADAAGTRIHRTFRLEPTGWATAPLVWAFARYAMAPAVRRGNAALVAAMADSRP